MRPPVGHGTKAIHLNIIFAPCVVASKRETRNARSHDQRGPHGLSQKDNGAELRTPRRSSRYPESATNTLPRAKLHCNRGPGKKVSPLRRLIEDRARGFSFPDVPLPPRNHCLMSLCFRSEGPSALTSFLDRRAFLLPGCQTAARCSMPVDGVA